MLEILNLDMMKYISFLLGIIISFCIITERITFNKKFLISIIIGFLLGIGSMYLFIKGFNIYLFLIFWLLSSIGINTIFYNTKNLLDISRINIIILLILVMSMVIKYGNPQISINIGIILGIFLLSYIFFIPFFTGLSDISKKSKIILYYLSWTTIIFLLYIYISDIIVISQESNLNILNLFVKGVITTYILIIGCYIIRIFSQRIFLKKINKNLNNIIIDNFDKNQISSKEISKIIAIVIFIIIVNQIFTLINEYTLIALLLFINLNIYNKFLIKNKSKLKIKLRK